MGRPAVKREWAQREHPELLPSAIRLRAAGRSLSCPSEVLSLSSAVAQAWRRDRVVMATRAVRANRIADGHDSHCAEPKLIVTMRKA
jgi:hypothetical protein